MHAYDTKDLEAAVRIARVLLFARWTRAGHLNPVKRGGRLHYSFQDLIVLRTASALRAANIPAKRINRTLETPARHHCPTAPPSTSCPSPRLGNRIAIREGKMLWESDPGQYALALDIDVEKGGLHVLNAGHAPSMTTAPRCSADGAVTRRRSQVWRKTIPRPRRSPTRSA